MDPLRAGATALRQHGMGHVRFRALAWYLGGRGVAILRSMATTGNDERHGLVVIRHLAGRGPDRQTRDRLSRPPECVQASFLLLVPLGPRHDLARLAGGHHHARHLEDEVHAHTRYTKSIHQRRHLHRPPGTPAALPADRATIREALRMIVRFPDYKTHEQARVEANDAMMALLVAGRIAVEVLRTIDADEVVDIEGEVEWLPRLFPTVREMHRLNIRRAEAATVVEDAESHLVQMSIPFALSVHGAYIARCIAHLQGAGVDTSGTNPSTIRLKDIHGHISGHGRIAFSGPLLELFNLARMVRNRIIHHGATTGHEVKPAWRHLSRRAKDSWVRLADREPPFGNPSDRLVLQAGELFAVLAITKNLADAANVGLQKELPREYWARIVVDDYSTIAPERFAQRATRLRRVVGHARRLYVPLGLTQEELAVAIDERTRE